MSIEEAHRGDPNKEADRAWTIKKEKLATSIISKHPVTLYYPTLPSGYMYAPSLGAVGPALRRAAPDRTVTSNGFSNLANYTIYFELGCIKTTIWMSFWTTAGY